LLWIGAVAVLGVLYVLSSGPALTMSGSLRPATTASGVRVQVFDAGWWPQVYRPVWWAVQQPWGAPAKAYLQLFPVRRVGPPVPTPLPAGHEAETAAPPPAAPTGHDS